VYEQVINGSIQNFHEANDFVETQVNDYRQSVNYDTFGRGDMTELNAFKSTDIRRITLHDSEDLIQQKDPEDENEDE